MAYKIYDERSSVWQKQQKLYDSLKVKFSADRKMELGGANNPIIWSDSCSDLKFIIVELQNDRDIQIDYLTDLTAYDNIDKVDGEKRFIVVYQLFSLKSHLRVTLKRAVSLKEKIESVTSIFPSANWLEREVFDLYGIYFTKHPDLRRIMMDERFVGHPLRKEYPMKKRMPFSDNKDVSVDESPSEGFVSTHENSNIKSREMEKELLFFDHEERMNLKDPYNSKMLINIGPSHPAMHGTLRMMCQVDGENILKAKCELGYLHRAIEKFGEEKTYHQWIVYTDRLNYCSALNNNIAYVMAVESLLNIEITEKCMWIRMICFEISRIIDHIICVAINALDMGALTVYWHMYNWREEAYTLIESMCGMRLTTTYARIGGMSYDLPEGFEKRLERFCEGVPKMIDEMDALLSGNRIWIDRTRNVGKLSAEMARAFSVTGPVLRAAGVDFDLRRDRPYYAYGDLDFDIPIASTGDVYDRYLVRMEEMRQSVRILKQCLKFLPGKSAPLWVQDRRVQIPEKIDVYTKMEVLIHHFKIFMEGIDVPKGEIYNGVEGPNGELGFYIVSRGGPKAWRMRIKSPSFVHFQLMENCMRGEKIPDAVSIIGSVNIIAGELDR